MTNAKKPAPKRVVRPWTPEEEQRLRELYYATPGRQLASMFGRTWTAVRRKANSLKLYQGPVRVQNKASWTRHELDLLVELYPDGDLAAMSAMFGRSIEQIRYRAGKLGVKRSEAALQTMRVKAAQHAAAYRGRPYSDEELDMPQRVVWTAAAEPCRRVRNALARRTPLEVAWYA